MEENGVLGIKTGRVVVGRRDHTQVAEEHTPQEDADHAAKDGGGKVGGAIQNGLGIQEFCVRPLTHHTSSLKDEQDRMKTSPMQPKMVLGKGRDQSLVFNVQSTTPQKSYDRGGREVSSSALGFNVLSTTQGHLRTKGVGVRQCQCTF